MSCNCNSGETPEYYITLDGVGADGYSPQINIVQEDTSSFKLNLINKNNEQITPAIPKFEYVDLKLNKDGSNADNPITINNLSVQSVGTGTRVGSAGQLTLYGSTARPAYIPQGDTAKTLALFSDVTTKLNTDGSNATSNIAINGIAFRNQSNFNNIIKAKDGLNLELSNGGSILDNNRATIHLDTSGNTKVSSDNNINLSAINDIHLNTTNGKVYYGASTDASKEIATVGDIKNSTITLTQGGIVKGSFTLNQSANATIALDAGGGGVTDNQISLITEDGTRGITLGINNTTKEAFMTYDIIGGISSDLNLISGKITPITLTKNSDGTYSVGLDYDNDTLKVNQNGKLYADIEAPTYTAGTGINIDNEEISVDSDYIEAHKAYLADGDLLTDPQGLEDVKYYNKSSFDLSKFTIIGSPTITDDGIASGFRGANNAVLINKTFSSGILKINFEYIHKPVVDSYFWLVAFNISNSIGILGYGDYIYINSNQTDKYHIQDNTAYNITYETDLGTYEKLYVNGVLIATGAPSDYTITNIVLGNRYSPASDRGINGKIDLKQFSITVDRQEVFNGNKTGVDTYTIGSDTITIPYKVSKTGSKIVDSSLRPEVEAVYEDQGYAPYYTLDETNGNFTLPMGEIYGYITRLEGIVKDLQARLTALESNINAGGASEPVQRNLLGMSPLSLGRPQLLGEFNPEDEINTMDIEPIEDIIQEEEVDEEPQEAEEEPIEETVEEQEEPQEEGGENE